MLSHDYKARFLMSVFMPCFFYSLVAEATFEIAPSNGPAAGGNIVILTNTVPAIGDGTDVTNVTFGGTSVTTILGQGADWISVVVPAHAAGLVNIETYSVSLGVVTQENAYTYNPAGSIPDNQSQGWTLLSSLSRVTRGGGGACINNKVYVFGGIGSGSVTLTNVWSYNGSAWVSEPGLPVAKSYFATAVASNCIYVIGGYNSSFSATTNAYKFDGTNWSEVVGIPVTKTEMPGGTLNGNVYSLGQGTNVYRYDVTSWSAQPGLPISRARHMATEYQGKLYVIGGDNGSGAGQTNAYMFDGTTWTNAPGLPQGRRSAGIAQLNGRVYVFGGINSSGTASTNMYIFDGTNWTEGVGMKSTNKYDMSFASDGNAIYIASGQSPTSSNAWRYTEASTGVSPTNGVQAGGFQVTITGSNLGDGSDVTNVSLCGFSVTSIDSQNTTQVVVTAAAGTPITGDVRVYSTSYGETIKSNYFTYLGPNMTVLGTNNMPVINNEPAHAAEGTDFGSVTWGTIVTNTLRITNSGNSTLTISSWTTNGPHAANFGVVGIPATVTAGGVSNLQVSFAPPYAGAFTASVDIVNDSTSTPYIINFLGTGAKQDQTIDFPAIGDQETTNVVELAATATSGLDVTFAVGSGSASISDGTNLTFTGAGSVSIIASQTGNTNYNAAPDVTNTFNVTKAVAGVTLNDLAQTYDGTARTVTATTAPTGLVVDITYDGNAFAPTNAGSYAITGVVNDVMYQGSDVETLVVGQATANVYLESLSQTYDGSAKNATATSDPSGLTVTFTYDGSATAPSNAGSYAVTGTIVDVNYQGSQAGTLVIGQAAASVYLESLSHTYDGSAKNATATSDPSGLTVTFTYDGSATAPSNAGSYAVTGTVVEANYQGSATNTLTINAADQTINFPAIGDQETTNLIGLAATATSGLGVSFAVGSGPASISGGTNLSFTGAGSVSIIASQAGDSNWNAAPDVTNTFNVTKAVAGVSLNDLAQTYDGTARTVTATTAPTGLVVDITYDGSSPAPTNAGSYAVTGIVNDVMYQGSDVETLVVGQATANVYLESLSQTYDGSAKNATATSDPSGLTVTFTYDGSASAPTNVGSYAVTGTVSDANYVGGTNGTLTISKADQTIDFPAISDKLTTDAVGLSATGTSALAVSFAVGSGPASISGGTNLSFTGAGSVSIIASQAGDSNWNAAPDVTNTFNVTKAIAGVTLNDLSQTYDGSARIVTATTAPTGLVVDITYDGSSSAPTNAGSYAVTGVVNDVMYQGSDVETLVVGQAAATIYLESLSQTYDGSAKSATATTMPSGLTVTFTYDGSATAPSNAGSYAVTGTISDVNYQGSTSGTLVIDKAAANVYLESLSQTYDGSAKSATATTMPSGLTVTITYDGSATAPSNAGSYAVTGTIVDVNYEGSQADTLVIGKSSASVYLESLSQTYDGSAKSVTATTDPSGLTVTFTYDGSSTAPSNAGSYAVTGTVSDVNYQGSANETLTISKGDQTINFPAVGDQETTNLIGLAATATSGLGVNFVVDSGSASISGGTNLSFTGAGSVSIIASQPGDSNWNTAPDVTNTFNVTKATAGVTLNDLTQTYDGNARIVTVTTAPTGLTVEITYDGSSSAPTNAGNYTVTGVVNDVMYQGSDVETLTINKADQAITFPAIGDQLENSTVGLAATADSGLGVSFAVGSGPASISGGTNVTFSSGGTVSIVASQSGDSNWNPAPDVTNTFGVTEQYTLTIVSPYGTATPVVGEHIYVTGSELTNTVTTPDTRGTTQFVCSGWTMPGNSPVSGSGAQVTMTITNDVTLTWLWTTNYYLDTTAGANGSVDVADGFQSFGSTVIITATPDTNHHFVIWNGDDDSSANPLNLLIDAPKTVTANFTLNIEPWSEENGITNQLEDTDGDGASNGDEYIAGTSPTNAESILEFESFDVGAEEGSTTNEVQWTGGTNVIQYLEGCTDVVANNWIILATNYPPTPITNQYIVPDGLDILIYRIRAIR